MSRGLLALVLLGLACTPTLPPAWVLDRERELALRVQVVDQGPYGQPLDPDAPTVNEALPLDTVEAIPYVAGPDGPVDLGPLDPQWYLCDDLGTCLIRGEVRELAPCDHAFLVPPEPCLLDGGASVRLQLGDFFAAQEPDAIFAINRAPTLGFLASTDSGPGTDACLSQLAARESLEGCLWMERNLSLGSLGEVVDGLEALGYEVEVSESLQPLLTVPRNHNPEVRQLQVRVDGGDAVAYLPGQTVRVPVGARVTITYEPDPLDIDVYEITIDGDTVQVEDRLSGEWFASREVAELTPQASPLAVTWRDSSTEPVTMHFVLRDDRRAEAWGWLHFELSR